MMAEYDGLALCTYGHRSNATARRTSGNAALAHACALAGKTEESRKMLAELRANAAGRNVPAPMIARIYLGLGEIDRAFEWLKKGVEERSYWNVFLKMDPVYDPIRNDPRFQELLEGVGFRAAKRPGRDSVPPMRTATPAPRFVATS